MPANFEMKWVEGRAKWRKQYNGQTYYITCRKLRKLDFPADDTKLGSYQAANAWWFEQKANLDNQIVRIKYDRNGAKTQFNAKGEEVFVAPNTEKTLKQRLAEYLDDLTAKASSGNLQKITLATAKSCLNRIGETMGDMSGKVDEQTISTLRQKLHAKIAAEELKQGTARAWEARFKAFTKWQYKNNIIERLPKNIDTEFSAPVSIPQVRTREQIEMWFNRANDEVRLYILLGLNFGFTGKPISIFNQPELGGGKIINGRYVFKRFKTKSKKNVPTIEFKIWPETAAALKKAKLPIGRPLKVEEAWRHFRMCDSTFGCFRDTGASIIKNSPHAVYRTDYLGQAPNRVDDAHYAATSQEGFDEAIDFLHSKIFGA
jgi:hypothetical protein